MKLLTFAATNHKESINKQLVSYAASLISEADTELLDLNDYEMPIYSQDREEQGGIPEAAQQFYKKVGEADAVMIAFAEHNGSYTAAFKNIFDWASRIDQKVYQGKPMLLLATSPGPGGAQNVLASATTSAPFFAGEVLGSISVPSFYENFDSEKGQLKSTELDQQIREATEKLVEAFSPVL
ncbi:MAG: NAD(P)H-dependent oxidoreductase [Amphritea sp.]|nr:NAD(P)H-dependent oxidoreductase [Amphritea sp.]